MYKLQKAACNDCSENAKGSLCRHMAQTSFWAKMQKKERCFLLHSRNPHGGDEWNMAAIAIIKTMVFYIVIMCK
jgi:ADP-glucose pyrophosphorylase